MTGRDPDEPHRVVTPLELLFDLCFVVAVAQAGAELRHGLSAGEVAPALVSYFIVFFGVWWPWVNFTWFASAYDTDDVLYRLLTFVQIAGVLIVTAGVPRAFENFDYSVTVIGYIVMRAALVAQWIRVALEDPKGRSVALHFAFGIALVQGAWAIRLGFAPPWGYLGIFVLGLVELAIPIWAESSGRNTPWHSGHIAERYGLFTIIVLGECVFAATTAVQAALGAAGFSAALLVVAAGGLMLVFGLWWLYFKRSAAFERHRPLRVAIAWSYLHFVIFASVAALGAGLQVAVDTIRGVGHLAPDLAALTVVVPVAVFLLAIGILHSRPLLWSSLIPIAITGPLLIGIALAARWTGVPLAVLLMGLVIGGVVAFRVVLTPHDPERPASAALDGAG